MRADVVLVDHRERSRDVTLVVVIVLCLVAIKYIGAWVEDVDVIQYRKLRSEGMRGIYPELHIGGAIEAGPGKPADLASLAE